MADLISNNSDISEREYRRYRTDDGWPYCPNCGKDELYNPRAIRTDGTLATDAEVIAAGLTCDYCGWQSEAYKANTPRLVLSQENVCSKASG